MSWIHWYFSLRPDASRRQFNNSVDNIVRGYLFVWRAIHCLRAWPASELRIYGMQ